MDARRTTTDTTATLAYVDFCLFYTIIVIELQENEVNVQWQFVAKWKYRVNTEPNGVFG